MKFKKLLPLAVAALCTAGAWAQTDVTSQYLTNADFSQGTPVTVGVCTYAKDKTANGTDYANLVPVDGWTAVASADGKAGGLFAIGGGAWLGGSGFTAPATDSDGNTGVNVLGIVTCWGASVQYTQNLKQALPAGIYTLVLGAYNSGDGQNDITTNLIGFVEDGGTTHYANTKKYTSNAWKYEFITFTLAAETSGKISIGYTGAGSSNGLPHLFISGLTLFEGEVDAEAYEAAKAAVREAKEAKVKYDNALDAANAALQNSDYANVAGAEKITLETEVAKAEPTTTEAYNEAAAALQAATSAFTAAKTNYDIFAQYGNVTLAYTDASKKPVITSESTAASIIPALRAYYESHAMAEGVDGAVDQTSKLTNPNNPSSISGWTVRNTTGNSNMRTLTGEPYTNSDGSTATGYFDTNSWGSAFATTFTQDVELAAGRYILSVKARGNGTTTYQLTANGETTDIAAINNTGGVFDRGWNDYTVEFEVDEVKTVTLGMNLETGSSANWLSFGNFRLVRLELYTEMAKASDYAALDAAIASAKAKTLGFDAGEYAPYRNIDAIKAIATAEAINQNEENAKDEITALTTTLTDGWTVNKAKVNAINDGQFANTEALSESGKVVLPGWTKVDGIRLLVKDEATDPGLAYTEGEAAVFSWGGTTLTYGEQEGYTLPLNKHKLYVLTMKVSAWRDGDFPTEVIAKLDGVGETESSPAVERINASGVNPFVTLRFYLRPTADNSILTIYSNKHFTVADLSLKTTTAGDANGDGEIDAADVDVLAQIAVGKVTRHKNAADMNLDGEVTVSDVTRLVNLLKETNVIPTGEPNDPPAAPAFKDLED